MFHAWNILVFVVSVSTDINRYQLFGEARSTHNIHLVSGAGSTCGQFLEPQRQTSTKSNLKIKKNTMKVTT